MTPEAHEAIREHRKTLEDLAESDLPCAEIAEKLLEMDSMEATP